MKTIALVLALVAVGCASTPYCDGSPPAPGAMYAVAICDGDCVPLAVRDGVVCSRGMRCTNPDGSSALVGIGYSQIYCEDDGTIGIPVTEPDAFTPVCACD